MDDGRLCICGHRGWDHSVKGCGYLHLPDYTQCNRYQPVEEEKAGEDVTSTQPGQIIKKRGGSTP